ncbi:MAG TPA: ammonium transporter [Stellaceae bacterium]|nr:ammonium transporter [Stellaceae bacterium]
MAVLGCFWVSAAHAAPSAGEVAGNTAWILTSSALVLFMTIPGLAMFYGGLVGARNLLSVLMHCFVVCCIVSIIWVVAGYSLTFSGQGALLGDLRQAFLPHIQDVLPNGLPESVFVLFQMTFAIITPALIIGAFPERVRFSFVMAFTAGWSILVYLPVAHWIWGGGWLASLGTVDFAGGIVVHTSSGVAAILLAILIGPRKGFPQSLKPPHSSGMTMAGAGMLWVGWFGFNGGSALAANGSAGVAILTTHFAAAVAGLTWMVVEWVYYKRPTSVGFVTGCVAGLATITPAAGYVGMGGAMVIGLAAGIVCFFATHTVKHRLHIDDSLDVFAVHGVGGMVGSVLVAVLMLPALGGVGFAAGLDLGRQLLAQVLGVVVTLVWSGVVTVVLVKVLAPMVGTRVSPDEELEGLDVATHGERAYEHM